MKVLLIIYIFLFSSLALTSEEEIECGGSGNGTHLVYSNGVGWPRQMARDNIELHIWGNAVDHSLIDPKSQVHWHLAYNHSISAKWDMTEALSQFLVNNGGMEENLAYTLVFVALFNMATKEEFEEFKDKSNLDDEALHDLYVEFRVNRFSEFNALLEEDTRNLTNLVAEKLIKNDRVVAIADSQGTFYLNEMYRRLERGELPGNITDLEDFDFEEQKRFLASVHVAAATAPINPLNRTVLNNVDIIKKIAIFANEPNKAEVTFFEPLLAINSLLPPIDTRPSPEHMLNHNLSLTYLNTKGINFSPLQNLRKFTINSIHEAAALLPVPCIYCVSEDFPDGQLGIQTPDYGFISDTAQVTGNIIVRDDAEICGESVINAADGFLVIDDDSSLWNVKIETMDEAIESESYITNSKLYDLEIQDLSFVARLEINQSEIRGGLIVNDGTEMPYYNGNAVYIGRVHIMDATLNDVNVVNSEILRSTLSNLSIEKSAIDSIDIDGGTGVNTSYILHSHIVNSSVANSRIENSTIINSDILENSNISSSTIRGETIRTTVSASVIEDSEIIDSSISDGTFVTYTSITGSNLSGSYIYRCLPLYGVNTSGYSCSDIDITN